MTTALWIIAVCMIIRTLFCIAQYGMISKEQKEAELMRKAGFDEFKSSLTRLDKEFMKTMERRFDEDEKENRGNA